MQQRHVEQLKLIFPETPDHCGQEGTGTFYAFNKQLRFGHVGGEYFLDRWEHEYDYIRCRNFKVFLKKLEALRKDFEQEEFKKNLTANILCKKLEEKGFEAKVLKEPDNDDVKIRAVPPNAPELCKFSFRIGSDFIDAYHGVVRIYFMCGEPQYIIPGAMEAVIKRAKWKKLL